MDSVANKLLSEGWADTSKKLTFANVIGGGKGGGGGCKGSAAKRIRPPKSRFLLRQQSIFTPLFNRSLKVVGNEK